ncbi:ankyrin repeat-containing domain protein [Peziza echinospora]|nr:ankyrin repeat-containing domain protein [Peziza echinospora]
MAAAKEFVCHCHFKYYDSDVLNAFALLYSRITGSKAVTEWILKNQQDETSAIPKRVLPRELRKLVEEVDWSDPYFPNISNAFSTSLLMWSAQNTHDEITLLLLKFRDVHITAMEIYQYTSLPGAASMGSIASFRLLASENGVDMDDKLVMRCLLAAAHEGQAAVVEALIDRPLFYPALGNIRNLWLPACVTIAEGHVVIAKRILQRIKQHLAVKTEDTNSPLEPSAEIQNMLRILLTLCAEKGNRKIIGTMWKLGMGQGPKYLNGTCKFNWDEFPYFKAWSLDFRTMRPLDAAAAGGHETIIQMFLEAGADPTFDVASVSCWPALLGAAQGGHERIVHQLIAAGADVNHVHGSGCGPGPEDGRVATALILAVEGGHRNIVKTLLENRARIENAPAQIDRGSRYDDWRLCNGGHSALILAVAIGDEEIVHQLLKAGADVEFDEDCSCQHPSGNQSRKGTSLSIAAERGNLSILQILLNAGATDKSYGALWKAVAEGQLPALNLLLSALYTCHNRYGSDARWASHGIIEAIRFNKGDSVILEILLRSLKMVTHTFIEDLHQSRCLRGAVSAGHAACARMLLKTGVDSTWGLADEASESLLWLAVASNSEEMVDILLPRVTDIRHIQGCLLRLLGWHDYHSIHSELKQHPLMICSSSIVTKLRDARDRLNQRAKVAAAPVCVEE